MLLLQTQHQAAPSNGAGALPPAWAAASTTSSLKVLHALNNRCHLLSGPWHDLASMPLTLSAGCSNVYSDVPLTSHMKYLLMTSAATADARAG